MPFRNQIILGYLIIFFIMIVIASVTYQGIASSIKTAKWVAHTHQVIAHGNLVQKFLIDMETGQRGYLITGRDNFLEPFKKGTEGFTRELLHTKSLVTDHPQQVRLLEEIKQLARKWRTVAALPEIKARKAVNRGEATIESVSNLIERETGKSIMDELRLKLSAFIDIETKLLNVRQHESELAANRCIHFVVFGTVLGLVIGIIFMVLNTQKILNMVGGDPEEIALLTNGIAKGDLDPHQLDGARTSTGILGSVISMATTLNKKDRERNKLIAELRSAVSDVKQLSGLLPICSHCKKIRDDKGYWNQIEVYLHSHSGAKFSHGLCPDCITNYFSDK